MQAMPWWHHNASFGRENRLAWVAAFNQVVFESRRQSMHVNNWRQELIAGAQWELSMWQTTLSCFKGRQGSHPLNHCKCGACKKLNLQGTDAISFESAGSVWHCSTKDISQAAICHPCSDGLTCPILSTLDILQSGTSPIGVDFVPKILPGFFSTRSKPLEVFKRFGSTMWSHESWVINAILSTSDCQTS